jgi:hypothetical protein
MTPSALSRRAYPTHIILDDYIFPRPSPRIQLRDGHSLSVQAHRFAHCSPRCDGLSLYSAFEVGYPTFTPSFLEYAEDPESPTETVYPYVPAQLIIDELIAHGGLTFSERVATFCRIYTNEYFNGECYR